MTLYLVGINRTWSNEPTTLEAVKKSGFSVQPARLYGEYQIFHNGRMLGWLFGTQEEQLAFLIAKDWL